MRKQQKINKIKKIANPKIDNSKNQSKKITEKSNEFVRLNKFISEAGVASRRKADELIASGAVKVNKKAVTELGTMVHLSDFVTVNGNPINISHHYIYILLNKPKDCITSTSDEHGRKTVLDVVNRSERLFPVGRLDRNTTGTLLLTNNGEIANRLTHPRYQIVRIYNAKLDKILSAADAEKIAKGIEIEEGIFSSPCEIFIHPNEKTRVTITLTEGKNHEVKKLFEAVGYEVKSLDRKYYHNLSTKGLRRGEYRFLERKEILELLKLTENKF
jgi:23S rRNA pseudouridine2605 synthase